MSKWRVAGAKSRFSRARPCSRRPRRTRTWTRRSPAAPTNRNRSARGFNATTVDDIARNAGLTKGAIYFHFENKTAILVAALHGQGVLAETKTKYLLLFTLTLLEFNGTGSPIEERVRAIYDGFVQSLERIVRAGKASANSATTSMRARWPRSSWRASTAP